jgi:hypothetical protein
MKPMSFLFSVLGSFEFQMNETPLSFKSFDNEFSNFLTFFFNLKSEGPVAPGAPCAPVPPVGPPPKFVP